MTNLSNSSLDYNQMTDSDFRLMVHNWLKDNYPEELRFAPGALSIKTLKEWTQTLYKQGWMAPGWPKKYGGMGLDGGKEICLVEEFERYGAARIPNLALQMLGPLIIQYGTDAQKEYYLPRILSGTDIWAQGYSEPESGSDLASLRTEAILDGDEWVINGQKIWTTIGTEANWMFMLVKTDKTAKPQLGISFVLVPLTAPGVEVRPIQTLDRYGVLAEIFFNDVRIPKDNLVGEINRGWDMAKSVLGFERLFVGSPITAINALNRLEALAKNLNIWSDPLFQREFFDLKLDIDCHNSLYAVYAGYVRQGVTLGPDVSMLKIFQTDLFVKINELAIKIAGEDSGTIEPMVSNVQWTPSDLFLQSLRTTIYSGSNEIQREIITKNVLKLPNK